MIGCRQAPASLFLRVRGGGRSSSPAPRLLRTSGDQLSQGRRPPVGTAAVLFLWFAMVVVRPGVSPWTRICDAIAAPVGGVPLAPRPAPPLPGAITHLYLCPLPPPQPASRSAPSPSTFLACAASAPARGEQCDLRRASFAQQPGARPRRGPRREDVVHEHDRHALHPDRRPHLERRRDVPFAGKHAGIALRQGRHLPDQCLQHLVAPTKAPGDLTRQPVRLVEPAASPSSGVQRHGDQGGPSPATDHHLVHTQAHGPRQPVAGSGVCVELEPPDQAPSGAMELERGDVPGNPADQVVVGNAPPFFLRERLPATTAAMRRAPPQLRLARGTQIRRGNATAQARSRQDEIPQAGHELPEPTPSDHPFTSHQPVGTSGADSCRQRDGFCAGAFLPGSRTPRIRGSAPGNGILSAPEGRCGARALPRSRTWAAPAHRAPDGPSARRCRHSSPWSEAHRAVPRSPWSAPCRR